MAMSLRPTLGLVTAAPRAVEDMARRNTREALAVFRAAREYRRRVPSLDEAGDVWQQPSTGYATPVALVHGAAHNAGAWPVLSEALRDAGFERLVALEYPVVVRSMDELADDLGRRLDRVMLYAGVDRVHVVGHSLGGYALRVWYDLLGGDTSVGAAVTLGSPHAGISSMSTLPLMPGGMRDLGTRSALHKRLALAAMDHRRWTTIVGGFDVLVRSSWTYLPGARRVEVRGVGHLGLLFSKTVAGHVAGALVDAETDRAPDRVTPTSVQAT